MIRPRWTRRVAAGSKPPSSLHFTTHPQAGQGFHSPTSGKQTAVVITPIPFPIGRHLPPDRIVRLSRCRDVSLRLGTWDSSGRPSRARSDCGRTVFGSVRPVLEHPLKTRELTLEQTGELDGAGPDPGRVQQLARQAVQALRAAQEHVRVDAEGVRIERERIIEEHERLAERESHLADQRRDFEVQLAEIVRMTADIERQTADVDISRKQLEEDAKALVQRQTEWKTGEARLAEHEQRQAAATLALASREKALAQSERELETRVRALERRKRELEQQENELSAQRQQLDTQVSELNETRKTLTAMQAQLTRDHQEIVVQRDELLQRLGDVARVAPTGTESTGIAEEPITANATPMRGPKPAVAQAVDLFRKLRRDAKRKAIGV